MRRVGLCIALLLLISAVATAGILDDAGVLRVQVSPSIVKVGQNVEITVTTELRGEPVSGAILRVVKLQPGETIDSVKDVLINGEIGTTIGYTDANGKMYHAFDDWGAYVVYAGKEGYLGDLTEVVVEPLGHLYIDASIGDWSPGACTLEDLTMMNIDEALEKCSDKVTLIVRVADDAENPVSGAKVKVRGVGTSLELTTNADGEARADVKAGAYLITAEKEGYAPGFEVGYNFQITADQIREEIREKIEEAKSKALVTKELEGVAIKPSGYLEEVLKEEIAERAENKSLVNKLTDVSFENLQTYLVLSKSVRAVVLSAEEIPEAKVRIEGIGLGVVGYRGYEWQVFFADPRSDPEILDSRGISATVSDVLSSLENYKFELLNLSTHYRTLTLTLLFEGEGEGYSGLAIPVSVGYVADGEETSFSFLEQITENAGKFNRSERFSRSFVNEILNFESSKRIGVFRLKPAYWFDSDAFVKGVLIDVSSAYALLSLLPENLKDVVIPENAQVVFLEIARIPKAEFVSIEDIRKDPEKFSGELVAFQSVGEGVNVSTNQLLEVSLKAASEAVPALAPALAVAEANPIDILIQAEARWYPVIPSSRYQIVPVVGALSYDEPKKRAVEVTNEVGKVSIIYGYVVTRERFRFEYPVVIIQDKEFVREVSPSEVKAELKEMIEKIKERIRERVEEGVRVGTNLEKPKFFRVMSVIEPGKPETIEVGKETIERIKVKVREKVEDVVAEVRQLELLPEEIPKPPKPVYAYIEVTVNVEANNVEEADITFKVSKEWLAENNINKNTVTLMKYVNGQWISLDTRIVGEDELYVHYAAKTPSFSVYAITGGEVKPTTQTVTQTIVATTPGGTTVQTTATQTTVETTPGGGIPGFEVIFAIAGLIAVSYLLRRK